MKQGSLAHERITFQRPIENAAAMIDSHHGFCYHRGQSRDFEERLSGQCMQRGVE
jgi:hypothetical protein